jgi:hypothetical protein
MQTLPTKQLSNDLLDDIRMNWLGDTSSSTAHADRRIVACQAAATTIAADMKRQLKGHRLDHAEGLAGHREILLGYANGRSECILRESGESSRLAVELISLSALLDLMGPDWDEAELCGQGQRLWCQKNPSYLAGIRAAESDCEALADKRKPDALSECIVDLDASRGPEAGQAWLPFL